MAQRPAINPNVDDIADRAKHAFAVGTRLLADVQYRLGELAGTGRLDPDESMRLQEVLVGVWEELFFGTLSAVRHPEGDDYDWEDNTYSDGRAVRTKIQIEPLEDSDLSWEHNRFTLGDGAVAEHLRAEICYIAPVKPIADGRQRQPGDDYHYYEKLLDEAQRLEYGGGPSAT
jgi:hypothetical protein